MSEFELRPVENYRWSETLSCKKKTKKKKKKKKKKKNYIGDSMCTYQVKRH